MALIVQKYGGTSVGTLERIQHVVSRVMRAKKDGHDVVVVVSAMHGETDRLIKMAKALAPEPSPREFDALVSTGEQVSMALLAIALTAKNCPARCYNAQQIGIVTDNVHTKAHIKHINTDVVTRELAAGNVVIIAGFQGINEHGDVTTLGRGGSDTTAVAIAAALKAHECQIYTDVNGVYTTDPNMLANASLLPLISFEEMLEMSSMGAKVLQMRSVELASKHNIPIRVLSSFNDHPGTLVTFEERIMQKRLVSGIAFNHNVALITLSGVANQPGIEGQILGKISEADIDIDMIAQNASNNATTDFTFSMQHTDYAKALPIIQELADKFDLSVKGLPDVAKLTLVGIGMRSQAGVASSMFKALGSANINIRMITTSDIKISVVIDAINLEQGVRVVHDAFELDKLSLETQHLPVMDV